MRGAVVHDPEHAAGVAVRWLSHDLGDEAIEGHAASLFLTAAEELCVVDVERGQVGPGAAARVLVFDSNRLARTRGKVGCLRMRAWMLVFSSAQITNSSGFKGLPSHCRA